jgi:hypothetical protein
MGLIFEDLTLRKRMLFDNLIVAAERSCNTGLLLRTFVTKGLCTDFHNSVCDVSPHIQNLR